MTSIAGLHESWLSLGQNINQTFDWLSTKVPENRKIDYKSQKFYVPGNTLALDNFCGHVEKKCSLRLAQCIEDSVRYLEGASHKRVITGLREQESRLQKIFDNAHKLAEKEINVEEAIECALMCRRIKTKLNSALESGLKKVHQLYLERKEDSKASAVKKELNKLKAYIPKIDSIQSLFQQRLDRSYIDYYEQRCKEEQIAEAPLVNAVTQLEKAEPIAEASDALTKEETVVDHEIRHENEELVIEEEPLVLSLEERLEVYNLPTVTEVKGTLNGSSLDFQGRINQRKDRLETLDVLSELHKKLLELVNSLGTNEQAKEPELNTGSETPAPFPPPPPPLPGKTQKKTVPELEESADEIAEIEAKAIEILEAPKQLARIRHELYDVLFGDSQLEVPDHELTQFIERYRHLAKIELAYYEKQVADLIQTQKTKNRKNVEQNLSVEEKRIQKLQAALTSYKQAQAQLKTLLNQQEKTKDSLKSLIYEQVRLHQKVIQNPGQSIDLYDKVDDLKNKIALCKEQCRSREKNIELKELKSKQVLKQLSALLGKAFDETEELLVEVRKELEASESSNNF
ncbi:MAG: hypothetical protein CMO81_07235 [Waddliaceae bacterium]|nr:hypothetical protein [Waddliaceae bacterium]